MNQPELKWIPIEPSQEEIDFMEYQKYIARRIAAAFGLSLRDLGITDVVEGTITVPVYHIEREKDAKQAHS